MKGNISLFSDNASLTLENCTFVNFATAIQTCKTSSITINDVTIQDSQMGVDLSADALVNIDGVKFVNVKQPFGGLISLELSNDQHVYKMMVAGNFKIFNVTTSGVEKESNTKPKVTTSGVNDEQKMAIEYGESPEKDMSFNDSSIICVDD